MKRRTIFFRLVLLPLLAVISCHKAAETGDEIVLEIEPVFETHLTKTSAVSSIPATLYWGATHSSDGSVRWACRAQSVDGGKIYTGRYQTYSPTSYTWNIANAEFTTGGNMTVPNNNTDIVAGIVTSNSATPSITLNHIFARTGTLTMNTQSGYNITVNWWTITGSSAINGTAGTYNMGSQSWTATSASLGETSIGSGSDYYLIPGNYVIKCNYTLTKGWYSQTFTKSATVTLSAGYVNSITGTASGGSASEITMSVSLSGWNSTTHTLF